jgi:DNA-binding beta-propeller fold protein YncE
MTVGLVISSNASDCRLPAQEDVKPEAVLVNLLNPCGVAISPDGDYVFVSSRLGIYRYNPNYQNASKHNAVVEIDGYPKEADTIVRGSHKYEIGPLGLAFLDKDHLVVGDGSRKAGNEVVRVYKISPKPRAGNDSWVAEDAALYTLGPIKAGKVSSKGEENFYGVTVGAGALWVTCQGDDAKGWVAKAEVKDGKPGELKPAISTKAAVQFGTPGPVTFTPDGTELLIGQSGGSTVEPGESLLTFYDPANGSLKRKLKSGLSDLSGLAYSPKTKKLYATDFAWNKPAAGGLFELAIDGENVKGTRIATLDKPSALAFDKAGHLYLTVFEAGKDADKKKGDDPGALIYFPPGL